LSIHLYFVVSYLMFSTRYGEEKIYIPSNISKLSSVCSFRSQLNWYVPFKGINLLRLHNTAAVLSGYIYYRVAAIISSALKGLRRFEGETFIERESWRERRRVDYILTISLKCHYTLYILPTRHTDIVYCIRPIYVGLQRWNVTAFETTPPLFAVRSRWKSSVAVDEVEVRRN